VSVRERHSHGEKNKTVPLAIVLPDSLMDVCSTFPRTAFILLGKTLKPQFSYRRKSEPYVVQCVCVCVCVCGVCVCVECVCVYGVCVFGVCEGVYVYVCVWCVCVWGVRCV